MNEALLQFIWQHNLYQVIGLHTEDGEPLFIAVS
jgi:hypothetical protein